MDDANARSLRGILRSLRSKRMLVILLLGFSSGLPYMLMFSSLKIWLRREGVDLSTIGHMSWVMVPYTINFLWAPLLDRFVPSTMGRRRSWILISQVGIIAGFVGLGLAEPAYSLHLIIGLAIAVSFFSATQDIAIGAYRRESLRDEEQGLGASIVVYGYRIGIWVSAGLGLWMVDPTTLGLSFNQMFLLMAAGMSVGVITALWCAEPDIDYALPTDLKQAIVEPFVEFFKRSGVLRALLVLLFVLCFKMGDAFAAAITPVFYVDIGYSNAQIAEAAKGVGFLFFLLGLFIGGVATYRFGIFRSMLVFGILQALSTAAFPLLQWAQGSWWALAGVVALEDLSSAMGTAALVTFITLLANKRYTATQYALLSSLASFGRTFLSGFSGDLVERVGYTSFYLIGGAMALPGLVLLLAMWSVDKDLTS